MAQITISDNLHEALSAMKQALDGLTNVQLEIDDSDDQLRFPRDLKIDDFANRLLAAALQQVRKDLLTGWNKGTMLERFVHIAGIE